VIQKAKAKAKQLITHLLASLLRCDFDDERFRLSSVHLCTKSNIKNQYCIIKDAKNSLLYSRIRINIFLASEKLILEHRVPPKLVSTKKKLLLIFPLHLQSEHWLHSFYVFESVKILKRTVDNQWSVGDRTLWLYCHGLQKGNK